MNNFNKNLGKSIQSTNEILTHSTNEGKAFITFFHDEGWNKTWFPIMMNGRHLKFDDHFIMEICREKFGHTKFGISSGLQASRGNDLRNNL
jgi:hypothetical protein